VPAQLEAICDDCGHAGVVLLELPTRTMWAVLCAADYLERTHLKVRPPISAHAAGAVAHR
jgi:hypothetical protein